MTVCCQPLFGPLLCSINSNSAAPSLDCGPLATTKQACDDECQRSPCSSLLGAQGSLCCGGTTPGVQQGSSGAHSTFLAPTLDQPLAVNALPCQGGMCSSECRSGRCCRYTCGLAPPNGEAARAEGTVKHFCKALQLALHAARCCEPTKCQGAEP
mmetsp:Transcript_93404/g.241438  ORF Transcript_93404/g.241438 Transcript_93404/m.241438 type:complete len:155 (-) Transcript_93404:3114-3578(-)